MTSSIEQRRMERFSLEVSARLRRMDKVTAINAPVETYSTDISACGAFFVTDTHLPVGTEVAIDLFIPLGTWKKNRNKTHVHVSGFVVRTTANGVAISFDEQYQIVPFSQRDN